MKTQSEILKMFGWEKNKANNEIARQYQNFIKLINEIENDIINKEVQGENFIFSTSYGSYQFSVPENTDFHTYITVLLNQLLKIWQQPSILKLVLISLIMAVFINTQEIILK